MKKFEERLKELRIVVMHDMTYLGIIKKDEIKDDFLTDAIDCGEDFRESDIDDWFCCFNVDNVYEEIKLVGSTGYTVRSFNVHETRHAKQCLLIMEDSKRLALKQIENINFRKEMKK